MDHVTDQEGTLFPLIEKMLTPEKLEELSSDLEVLWDYFQYFALIPC